MDSVQRLNENSAMEDITDAEYKHVKRVWDEEQ